MKRTINTLLLFRPLVWRLARFSPSKPATFFVNICRLNFRFLPNTLAPRYTLHESITPISIEIDPQEFGKSPIERLRPSRSYHDSFNCPHFPTWLNTWRLKLRPFYLNTHPYNEILLQTLTPILLSRQIFTKKSDLPFFSINNIKKRFVVSTFPHESRLT